MNAGRSNAVAPPARDSMTPGDEAPPGAPSSGENVCPLCNGSGRTGANGEERCPECGGDGRVTTGIGGA